MKNSFERKRFIQRFVLLSLIFLIVTGVCISFLFGGEIRKICMVLIVMAVFLLILFLAGYREVDRVYKEIEKISEEMLQVVEGTDDLLEEEYKQGTLGILYTNFYKMVTFLKESKERELAAGLCTETDLLQAQKNLLSAQTALQSTTDQANKALRQLAILLGKSGTSITLGEIPAVSATELASMNLDADRAAAVVASSSVKSARRSSATGDAARKLRHQQIEEAESAASASADEQYAEIAALSLERDAAQAAYQSAEKTYSATQIKYQSGAINKATYLQGEASYLQKKAELETAEISLRTAYDAYEWMLKGVA